MNEPLINISPSFLLNPNIMWLILAVALLIFGFISIVLIFHWVKYSLNPAKATLFSIVYSVVSILLIGIAIASLGYYQLAY